MNKSVPTLLGVAVILLVVILVLSVYHMTMLARLAQGERVVGTTAQKMLGGEVPSEEMNASEALAARMSEKEMISAADVQAKAGKAEDVQVRQSEREARGGTPSEARRSTRKPGG